MSKQTTLFILLMLCLLGLFLLPMSSTQTYAKNSETVESEENLEASDAVQQRQDSPVDYKSRGRSYLEKGQNDDAISDFDKAIELNPKDAEIYFFRGNAYHNKRQFDKAMSDYSKAIEINPRYTNAYYSRGLYYQTIEEYRKAISDFDKVIKIDPENAYAYYYRGCAHFAKEKYRKALSDYNKAIKIDPEYVNPYINRGYYYHTRNEYPQAIADYKKALELNPFSPTAKQFLENAITDRRIYEERIRDNKRVTERGVTIRQGRVLPRE